MNWWPYSNLCSLQSIGCPIEEWPFLKALNKTFRLSSSFLLPSSSPWVTSWLPAPQRPLLPCQGRGLASYRFHQDSPCPLSAGWFPQQQIVPQKTSVTSFPTQAPLRSVTANAKVKCSSSTWQRKAAPTSRDSCAPKTKEAHVSPCCRISSLLSSYFAIQVACLEHVSGVSGLCTDSGILSWILFISCILHVPSCKLKAASLGFPTCCFIQALSRPRSVMRLRIGSWEHGNKTCSESAPMKLVRTPVSFLKAKAALLRFRDNLAAMCAKDLVSQKAGRDPDLLSLLSG